MRRSRRARSRGGLRPIDGAVAVTAPVGRRLMGRDDGLIGAEAVPSAAAQDRPFGCRSGQALRPPLRTGPSTAPTASGRSLHTRAGRTGFDGVAAGDRLAPDALR